MPAIKFMERVTRIHNVWICLFESSGGWEEEFATDLLADLLHWCHFNQVDFDRMLDRADLHHVEELAD